MFKYFPHTPEEINAMLEACQLTSLDDLFTDVPEGVKLHRDYNVPSSMSEYEVIQWMSQLAAKNQTPVIFRGAGAYDHYIPTISGALASRQEFLTSYTPYQPEVAQGTLQYIFEFQSVIAELTGMDVSNASMYDGATATAEAAFMAQSITDKSHILVSEGVHPYTREVIETYAKYRGMSVETIPNKQGLLDRTALKSALTNEVAGLVVQQPSFEGTIDDFSDVAQLLHGVQSVLIMNVNPLLASVLKTPRSQGADIVCGDAQPLGIPLGFGGPYVGFLTTLKEYVRRMPGRICGMTKDVDGKRGFVLTLQAREQHIRREKANSNICSNQSLNALQTAIYCSTLGKAGVVEVATRSIQGAHVLYQKFLKTKQFSPVHSSPFAHEFVLRYHGDPKALEKRWEQAGMLGGLSLGKFDARRANEFVFCVTEKRTLAEMDALVAAVEVK